MLQLQKFTQDDYGLYTQLVFDEQVMRQNLGRVFTDTEARQFFAALLAAGAAHPVFGYYKVYREDGAYIGLGALNPSGENNAVELEYMLLPAYWHRGYGTRLLHALLRLTGTVYEKTTLAAITDPQNLASRRLLEHAGFAAAKEFINADGEPAVLYTRQYDRLQQSAEK